MKISHIESILKTLKDLSAIRQGVKIKSTFLSIVYNF